MLDFNFFSASSVLLIHLLVMVILTVRLRQTRNIGLIGIIFGVGIVAYCYGAFTYNAYVGQSNAPLRYLLRLGNGVEVFSIGVFSIMNWYGDRKLRAALERVRCGGQDGP